MRGKDELKKEYYEGIIESYKNSLENIMNANRELHIISDKLRMELNKKQKETALLHAQTIFTSELASSFDKPEAVLKYAKEVHAWLITD